MKVDRNELDELLKAKKRESVQQSLGMLEQAEVSHKSLTGFPEWDLYLQELQARLESARKAKESFSAELESPETVDPIEERRLKNRILILTERIGTLDACINLPTDILKQAQDARDSLAKL